MTSKINTRRKDPASSSKSSKSRKRSLDQQAVSTVAVRDCSSLYASPITIQCAQIHNCIPCAYKIGLFDVSLDSEFTKLVPNARPEQCPRSSTNKNKNHMPTITDGTIGFQKGMAALTVGDGDFSYSLALARIILAPRNSRRSKKSTSMVIATSYESRETLQKTYPRFEEYSRELASLGAKQYFNVDATRLVDTLIPNVKDDCKVLLFDRICWNFPCTAIANGQDGQNDAMEKNKDLVRQFVKDANELLSDCGEIHMCHKTKPPYNQWGLEDVALEWLEQQPSTKNSLVFAGKVVLDRSLIPPYRPLKALDRKSFPCHDACFYIFRRSTRTNKQRDHASSFPPTIDMDDDDAQSPATVPVTQDMILSIRRSLLQAAATKTQRKNGNKRQKKNTK